MRLTIGSAGSVCTVYPKLGGSLGGWVVAGQAMLRTTGTKAILAGDPLGMASFPLVPFSNRIGNGRFKWSGATVALARNFLPEPHAIHGIGWQRAWTVADHANDALTLTLAHAGDDSWPWPFDAEQRITVAHRRLTLALSVCNRAAQPVPLAFGHHPYFDQAGATLQFAADRVWMAGDDALPIRPQAPAGDFDFRAPAAVAGRSIDNCYAGVAGPVRIDWTGRPLALAITASPRLPAAVVYIDPDADSFCFEPVPHINNALNLPGHAPAMPIMAPDQWFRATIDLRAVAAE